MLLNRSGCTLLIYRKFSEQLSLSKTNPMHALTVEDDDALQDFYEHLLERSGYTVSRADSAAEALDILENAYSLPALVILDIRMPGGNGFAVLDYLEGHPRAEYIHVAVVTAGTEFEAAVREYSFASFHLKPILPAQILEIAEAVKQHP